MRLRRKHLFLLLLISITALTGSGCAHRIEADDISQLKAGRTFDRQGSYRIGIGDEVSIRIFGDEEISGDYIVSPTGYLNLPLINPIQASGLTASQVTVKVRNAVRRLIKNPRVTVSLTGVRSFQVYFAGEVNRVGSVNLTNETSFLQALALAGGLTDFASGRIILIRKVGQNKIKRFATTYEEILTGDELTDYITLESGDVIYAE
jgi:polysaccharide export outer membrane protein